ncbi:MAG: serine hydrolase [Saprospiraceae bacterium]
MSTKTTLKFCIILILNAILGPTTFSQEQYDKKTLRKIKEVESNISGNLLINDEKPGTITERMAKYQVNGLSIAVIHDYKIAWAKGYGWADVAEKRAMSAETLFEPGSISKSLNAVGILKLAQDKKVDLYTDVNQYLKSRKFPYDSLSKGKKITLANLLSHNAGLTVHGFPGHDINGPIPTIYEVLEGKSPSFTPAVRSMYEPDQKFEYSGGGTSISQVLLTDVTQQAYDTWMYENVLKQIGMVNSSYAQPPAKDRQALCSSAYNRDGTPIENKFHVYPEQAAAGLWMTPSDLCQYIIDMQMAYQGKKPSAVLSNEMVKLHLSPYNNGPTSMGSFIEDHDGTLYFEHGAGNDGFCGDFYGSMEGGYGVVIFMNTDNPKLIPEVINSVAKAYKWKNFYRDPKRKKTITIDDSVLKSYEGIYLYDQTWAAVGQKDNAFHFYTSGQYVKMYYTSPTTFFNEEFAAVKTFVKDEKGNIIGYTRNVNGKEFPRSTKISSPDSLQLQSGLFEEIGWYLFENKKLDASIAYLKRGVQLYPSNLDLLMDLASAYLYHNEYDKAIAIFKAHLKDEYSPNFTGENMLQHYYNYFKDNKYDMSRIDKVFEELKIKKDNEHK